MQRAASLMPLPALLADLGADFATVLDGTGITQKQLRPDAFLPYAAFGAILERAAEVTGRSDLGLLLGQRQTLAALGPLGEVLRHAPTLGDALAQFAAFQSLNSTGGAVYLMRADRDVLLGYGVYDSSSPVSPTLYDLVLAVGCTLIAELTRGAMGPREMLLSRTAPEDATPYLRLGRCPVRFRQAQTSLLIRAPALDFPLPEASVPLHAEALARLLSSIGSASTSVSERLRHLLRPLLLMGQAGMPEVAAQLLLHPRALRRQLRSEGTTFEALKDEIRHVAARELLRIGDLSVADIALALDYANASAFVHAFRRWNGLSPGRWRMASVPS